MTLMTVAISATTKKGICSVIEQAATGKAAAVELRLDYLKTGLQKRVGEFIELAHEKGLKVIVTLRHENEGGHFCGDATQRNKILERADQKGADYIDIEWKNLQQAPFEPQQAELIVSAHDFEGCPAEFADLPAFIQTQSGGIPKMAYMPETINDSFMALDIMHQYSGSIAIAMGEAGMMTRLLSRKLQGLVSFFSPPAQKDATAPGQMDIEQAHKAYRWDYINVDTQLFGICGYPVGHSMSPMIHNSAFDATGYNGLYLPLLIAPEAQIFDAFISHILERPWLNFRGLSVTVPHKLHAMEAVKRRGGRLDGLAEKIGAINTIIFEPDGTLAGYNTDYTGSMNAIYETLGLTKKDLKGMPAAVLGAGGAARALTAGLTDAGATVTVFNRTVSKAKQLADTFECSYDSIENLSQFRAKLVVNCTSLGMYPNVESCAVEADYLRRDMIVFDTVYNPLKTKLLQQAEQAGAKIVDGLSMFINQGADQFRLFTNTFAPAALMRKKAEINLLKKEI